MSPTNRHSEIKGTDPLKLKVRDRDEVIGQVIVPLSQIPGPDGRCERWAPLSAPHRSSFTAQGELSFESWVSKGKPFINSQLNTSRLSESPSPMKPAVRQQGQSSTSSGISESVFEKTSLSSHLATSRRLSQTVSRSTGDLTGEGGSVKGHKKNASVSSLNDVRHDDTSKSQSDTHESSVPQSAVNNKQPEVTGISPRSGPISGGTRLTLRGSNLGRDSDDVIGLTVCGIDCLSSMEYSSPAKLICTTFPASKSVSGPVVVETQSGGRGKSTVTFTYKQHDYDMDEVPQDSTVISHPRLLERPGSNKKSASSKRDKAATREAELEERIQHLECHVKDLEEENIELKAYVDNILKKVMEKSPEILMHT
ncbi:hepatocyte growth factor receptor-like isoform X2 [Corticium candelabrum]|uniref:hepatocyte growth factor receptor-like isoform X2 n=1 Tax=Corticium candelabrum TaxID=121492 RepID=UPI002E26CFD6|nr:hepatocyte growth factor receptor-like isoform X2 [Corticium candelabrum]